MDIHLGEEEAQLLRNTIGDEPSPVRLQLGDGHSGYGLYVSHGDYPEEGSVFLASARGPGVQEGESLLDATRGWKAWAERRSNMTLARFLERVEHGIQTNTVSDWEAMERELNDPPLSPSMFATYADFQAAVLAGELNKPLQVELGNQRYDHMMDAVRYAAQAWPMLKPPTRWQRAKDWVRSLLVELGARRVSA